ncbi:hypothetical protein BLAT2472_60360 [Burkholderia latens]
MNFTALRVVVGHAFHTLIDAVVRSPDCRSPLEITVFGVVVCARIGALVCSGVVAHRRDSQCFESSRGGLSTSKPVFSFDCMPMLTIEKHRVLSVRRRRYPHPCRHSRHAAAERALALSRRPDGRRDSDDARRSVDIPLPNRLANLCIRTVRAKAAPARRSRAVWISLADIDSSHCGFRR